MRRNGRRVALSAAVACAALLTAARAQAPAVVADAAPAAADNPLKLLGTAVVVVLGSRADDLEGELDGVSVEVMKNPAWGKGMGTSVRMGMEALRTLAPEIDGVLLTLCDQPLVGPVVLGQLCDAFERAGSTEAIVAAVYNGTPGVPAIFGRAHFDELLALPDDAGAKPVLLKHRASVIGVPLPEAAVDIDTREQYERFMAAIKNAQDGN